MSGPRLVIVSRWFWPVIDDSTLRLQAWLRTLKKLGVRVSLFTALWNHRWPLRCTFDEVSLQRIGPPPLAARSSKNYLRGVVDHLVLNRSQYDAIFFERAAEEAIACCHAKELGDKTKLLWFDPMDCADGLLSLPSVIQDACRSVDRVLVHGAAEERVVRSAGILPDRIERLGQVTLPSLSRASGERGRCRTLLSQCCGDLFVPLDGKVIVVPSTLQHRPSIEMFLQAVDPLLDRWPSLRVWFIGDGPERGRIYERIRDMDGARQIALPGCFDCVDDIFQLADVCMLTTPGEGLGFFAPLAWENNIPCLLPASGSSKERTPEMAKWGLFQPGNMPQLRELLGRALEMATDATIRKQRKLEVDDTGYGWNLERWDVWARIGYNRSAPSGSSITPEKEPVWKRWTS